MSVTVTIPAWVLAAVFTFLVTIALLLFLSLYFAPDEPEVTEP